MSAEAEPCYFSDLYRLKGRDPEAHDAMAVYTASIYCPQAPIDEMIPVVRGANSRADLEASERSLRAQVARGQVMTGQSEG